MKKYRILRKVKYRLFPHFFIVSTYVKIALKVNTEHKGEMKSGLKKNEYFNIYFLACSCIWLVEKLYICFFFESFLIPRHNLDEDLASVSYKSVLSTDLLLTTDIFQPRNISPNVLHMQQNL